MTSHEKAMTAALDPRPLVAAATTLGIGLGGFFDGIVFHQILQVHNMLSERVPCTSLENEQINMFWDGLFHAFCYVAVLVGLWLLWGAVTRRGVLLSGKVCVGGMVLGWGLFNLVEGTIDHEILGVHHVLQNGNHLLWDMGFLAWGLAMIVIGWAMIRQGTKAAFGMLPS